MQPAHLGDDGRIQHPPSRRLLCFLVLFSCLMYPSSSFQPSITKKNIGNQDTISGSLTGSKSALFSLAPERTKSVQRASSGGGVTSTLISQLAIVALKLRLADQSAVKCNVNGSSTDLLMRGSVGPVTVMGRKWRSPLGLTCRAIEATVQNCQLDMGAIVSRRKLVLTVPAEGDAMIAMDDADFGSFITHPLMKPPAPPSNADAEAIKFLSEGVEVDAATGTVTFYGLYMSERWRCELRRGGSGGKGAIIQVSHSSDDSEFSALASELTSTVSDFFNEMVFELDGTFLSFRDMMVTDRSNAPIVMLSLRILVRKFPSPGLAF